MGCSEPSGLYNQAEREVNSLKARELNEPDRREEQRSCADCREHVNPLHAGPLWFQIMPGTFFHQRPVLCVARASGAVE